MRMHTWTLTALARTEWGIPRPLEVVHGVKTNKIGDTAAALYQKYPECHEVAIKQESE